MSLYQIVEKRPPIDQPVLIVALEGWVNAGEAATTAARRIAKGGELIAAFDPDSLFDYRARRPALDISDGTFQRLTWPDLNLRLVTFGGRDLLVLTGHEPDYRWRAFSRAVRELATEFGVIQAVSLGAIAWATPHTHPTQLVTTASNRELLRPEDRFTEGPLRVPAAAVTVVDMALSEHGTPTVGFFAQVPHYVSSTYYPAVIALLERLGRHLGLSFDTADLATEASKQRSILDAAVAQREEVEEYVQQLEQLSADGGSLDPDAMPSGDDLADEIERFLRGARGED